MVGRFGVKWVYLIGATAAMPCFALFPVMNSLARSSIKDSGGLGVGVWIAVGLQLVTAVLIFSCYGTSHSEGAARSMDLIPSIVRFRRSIHLRRRRRA